MVTRRTKPAAQASPGKRTKLAERRGLDLSHLYEFIGDIDTPMGMGSEAMGASTVGSPPRASAKPVRTIAAGEFKAKCLAILDEVEETGEEVIVTKRGREVAKLGPVDRPRRPGRPSLAHYVRFTGDVESPIDVEWDAMK